MPAKAQLRYLRIAPRKVRLVADLIRGKKVKQAKSLLEFSSQKSASILLKLLKSAIVSAKDVFQLEENNLYISKITVDEGPKLKRWRPRSRGRAYEIQKKTSHITLFLDGIKEGAKKSQKIKKKKEKEEVRELDQIPKEVPKKEKPKFGQDLVKIRPSAGARIRKIFRRKSF